jgi:hypothetical protein
MSTLASPFRRSARGWGTLNQQNHAATGGENSSIIVGMFVCLCLDSQKSSKRETGSHPSWITYLCNCNI